MLTTVTTNLIFGIETDLAKPYVVGQGAVVTIQGWCYHPQYRVSRLWLVVDGKPILIKNSGLIRQNRTFIDSEFQEIERDALKKWFYIHLPISPINAPRSMQLQLRAESSTVSMDEVPIGTLYVVPQETGIQQARIPTSMRNDAAKVVAICMATYNPPMDLFRKQIESIQQQTHTSWICVINDDCSDAETYAQMQHIVAQDDRFLLFQNGQNRGFYSNFEEALKKAPRDADFIALADQDDFWYPRKIEESLAAFQPETTLVYTDMDIAKPDGTIISHTYWTGRRNNYTDFKALLFANTITGAASIFRAGLLDRILPFPVRYGDAYHDHWIACVAMAEGSIAYINKPMYAYHQHGGNIIGHNTGRLAQLPKADSIKQSLLSPEFFKRKITKILFDRREIYFEDVMRVVVMSMILRLRERHIEKRKKQIIQSFAQLDHNSSSFLWETLLSVVQRRSTLGQEWYCYRGAMANGIVNNWYGK